MVGSEMGLFEEFVVSFVGDLRFCEIGGGVFKAEVYFLEGLEGLGRARGGAGDFVEGVHGVLGE